MRKFECNEKKRIGLKKIEYRCESDNDKNTLTVKDQNDYISSIKLYFSEGFESQTFGERPS